MYIPAIIEETKSGERAFDIFSYLLKHRKVYLSGEIDGYTADAIVSQLTYLSLKSEEPIDLYINSPGGAVVAGLAIVDTMDYINAPVRTLCIGTAASMGAIILLCGENGMRRSLQRSEIMLHNIYGGAVGHPKNIQSHAEHSLYLENQLRGLIKDRTLIPESDLDFYFEKDTFINTDKAIELGIIDSIVEKYK